MNSVFVRQASSAIRRWMEEGVELNPNLLHQRAGYASSIGEIDKVVYSHILWKLPEIFAYIEHVAQYASWWQSPDGEINPATHGHQKWAEEHGETIEGLLAKGWGRGNGTLVVIYEQPTERQLEGAYELIRKFGGAEGGAFLVEVKDMGHFAITDEEAQTEGMWNAFQKQVKQRQERQKTPATASADDREMFEYQNSLLETMNDGSTGMAEKSIMYSPQDLTEPVWWARQMLEKWKKNYPAKKDVQGPEPDAGSIDVPAPTPIASTELENTRRGSR